MPSAKDLAVSAGFSDAIIPGVSLEITLTKSIRQHKGESNKIGSSRNTTVDGEVSICVKEASPGTMSPADVYALADEMLSAGTALQLEENSGILTALHGG